MADSPFTVLLEPLLALGHNHPAVEAVRDFLREEKEEMAIRATVAGLDPHERAWWCGAATHARDLLEVVDREIARREHRPKDYA